MLFFTEMFNKQSKLYILPHHIDTYFYIYYILIRRAFLQTYFKKVENANAIHLSQIFSRLYTFCCISVKVSSHEFNYVQQLLFISDLKGLHAFVLDFVAVSHIIDGHIELVRMDHFLYYITTGMEKNILQTISYNVLYQ